MNDRQKQHLKILSEMDEKIVEEVTVERYRRVGMLAKRKKKRLISILSAAASFVIVLSATMVLWKHFGTNDPVVPPTPDDTTDTEPITPPDERQVPVYEGMTIESAETVGALLATTDAPILFLDNDQNNGIGHAYGNDSVKGDKHNPNRGDEINQDKPFGEDNLILDAAKDSLSIVGADQDMYYARPNEDIYFVIHINNPDAFEILSFTINGTKYSSYMFEEGSDLETLILKYNVGDVEGIVEYTIDAIKYIDGTEIKDVRMEGDRTVTAGIYTEEIQPKLTLTAENIGLHSLSFRVSVADEKNLIGGSEGKAYAVLYDGETILKQTELKVGEETTVTFDGLQSGKLYEYAIIGVYDAFDGNKVAAHTLTSKAFYTESVVTFDEINVTDSKITYALKWSDLASNKTLKTLTLTQGDNKTELDVNTTEIALLSNAEYTLTATYETNGTTETIEISFRTVARVVPTVTLGEITTMADGISFELNETDESNIGAVSKVEMIQNNEIKYTENGDVRAVTGMTEGGEYTVKITYNYDMNNGTGVQTVVFETTALAALPESQGVIIEDEELIGVNTFALSGTTLVIPDGVTSIAEGALDGCRRLTELTIPDGVTSLPFGLLSGFDQLTSLTIPFVGASLNNDSGENTHFGYIFGFNSGRDPSPSDYVPSSLKNVVVGGLGIDGFAFGHCSSLTSVIIKEGVTEIGSAAFDGCTNLTSVTIPEGVTGIYLDTFSGCYSLTNISLPDSITFLNASAFFGCENCFEEENGVRYVGKWVVDFDDRASAVLRSDTVGIGAYAFSGCHGLTSITIPNSVRNICERAFYECSNLTSITIPEGVTSIGYGVFQGCSSLTSITISNSVTSIEDEAFCDCDSLTSITIPEGVTSIGDYAFRHCSSLTSVTIGNGVTSIGDSAFSYCSSLTSVTIGNGVTSIGSCAFYNCNNLTSVEIPNGVTSIGYSAFSGCSSLTSVTFENTEGWWRSVDRNAPIGTSISSTDLADASTAAIYLTSSYYNYYWRRG